MKTHYLDFLSYIKGRDHDHTKFEKSLKKENPLALKILKAIEAASMQNKYFIKFCLEDYSDEEIWNIESFFGENGLDYAIIKDGKTFYFYWGCPRFRLDDHEPIKYVNRNFTYYMTQMHAYKVSETLREITSNIVSGVKSNDLKVIYSYVGGSSFTQDLIADILENKGYDIDIEYSEPDIAIYTIWLI